MEEKKSNNDSGQQNNVTDKLKAYRATFNGFTDDCVKNLLDHYDIAIGDMAVKPKLEEQSEILRDFVVAFLVNTTAPEKISDKEKGKNSEKNGNEEKTSDKYSYFIPETFLCWALFEYAHYKEQKTLQFVNETLAGNKLELKSENVEKNEERRKLIQIHYDAYKHLAANKSKEICEHLQTSYLKKNITGNRHGK